MKKGLGESRWRRVVRFSLGNKIREGRYWEKGREKDVQAVRKGKRDLGECREWMESGGSW